MSLILSFYFSLCCHTSKSSFCIWILGTPKWCCRFVKDAWVFTFNFTLFCGIKIGNNTCFLFRIPILCCKLLDDSKGTYDGQSQEMIVLFCINSMFQVMEEMFYKVSQIHNFTTWRQGRKRSLTVRNVICSKENSQLITA